MSVEVVPIIDGKERPVWALRAGYRIVQTEYDHDRRRMTIWAERELPDLRPIPDSRYLRPAQIRAYPQRTRAARFLARLRGEK